MAKKKIREDQSTRLFTQEIIPAEAGSGKLFEIDYKSNQSQPESCLGIIFPDADARRAFFIEKLRIKLNDESFRKTDGFPLGTNEEILNLSDPPYFTACPNPFLSELISHSRNGMDENTSYSIPPYASDVAEGRHTWVYKAHTYHTKVPPKAIQTYIEHYTQPGDIVLDGFSGSGMTALAASMCERPRFALTCDLSPAAAFITSMYQAQVNPSRFMARLEEIADVLDDELGWMYSSDSSNSDSRLCNYFVWSDVFICSSCNQEIVFWDAAFDATAKSFADEFECPSCKSRNSKTSSERAQETVFDQLLGKPWTRYKQVPVLAVVSKGGRRAEKRKATTTDLSLLTRVRQAKMPDGARRLSVKMLFRDGQWGDQWKNCMHLRFVTHAHQLFTERQLHYLGRFLELVDMRRPEDRALMYACTSILQKTSRLMVYNADGIGRVQKGTLYISSVFQEMRFSHMLRITGADLLRACGEGLWTKFPERRRASGCWASVWSGSSTSLPIPDSTVDYIFVDPPFGANIPYSELNFLWEAVLGVSTNTITEAIQSPIQNKGLNDYQELMERCFSEFRRVLKPGRWLTVEFHNSKNSVWNSIQEAIMRSGFVVADVRILDKKQKSFKQATTAGAVKQDLIISAYKPIESIEKRAHLGIESASLAWDFVEAHMSRLPVFVERKGKSEVILERQKYLIFDRMVAFHIQRGLSVPLSAGEFYQQLSEKYPEREGMYFLPSQVAEYDSRRMEVLESEQLELFISNEKGAIQWVRQMLSLKPMSIQEMQPLFMKEAQRSWDRFESPLELKTILEENFIQDGGVWRVPDPKREADLDQIRFRNLLREFQAYCDTGKKLKVVRTEAILAGFKDSWQRKDYQTIVEVSKRLPDNLIADDHAILMYYDNARVLLDE